MRKNEKNIQHLICDILMTDGNPEKNKMYPKNGIVRIISKQPKNLLNFATINNQNYYDEENCNTADNRHCGADCCRTDG